MKCDFKDNGMIGSKVVIGQYNKLKNATISQKVKVQETSMCTVKVDNKHCTKSDSKGKALLNLTSNGPPRHQLDTCTSSIRRSLLKSFQSI